MSYRLYMPLFIMCAMFCQTQASESKFELGLRQNLESKDITQEKKVEFCKIQKDGVDCVFSSCISCLICWPCIIGNECDTILEKQKKDSQEIFDHNEILRHNESDLSLSNLSKYRKTS